MIWGLIFIAYILPFWIWQVSRHEKIEARKRLYPGREQEFANDDQLTKISLAWGAGLALMILTWFVTK